MELDDLRYQWQQQPATTPPPVSPAELGGMLAHNAGGLVEKMRRNTWYEVGLMVLIVAAVPFCAWRVWGQTIYMFLAVTMLLISVILLVSYYQQLQLLRRMSQPDTQVRAHLAVLCAGLRRQLRFYYRLTVLTVPYMMLTLWAFHVGKELAHPGAFHWKFLLALAAAYAVLGALVQVVMVYSTRWYLQRLYGQHLDRLEANLHELGDEAERAA